MSQNLKIHHNIQSNKKFLKHLETAPIPATRNFRRQKFCETNRALVQFDNDGGIIRLEKSDFISLEKMHSSFGWKGSTLRLHLIRGNSFLMGEGGIPFQILSH